MLRNKRTEIIVVIECTNCWKEYKLSQYSDIPNKCNWCWTKRDEVTSWDLPF